VTVKPQVDGVLVEVRFKEGQDVRVGDVLARIDPRTYQAALDQQVAKKAQDQANLANARLDLVRYQKLAATAYTSAQQADTQKSTVAQLEAQVAQDQALIDNARAQLSYTTITAPIDGRAGIRQVDAGNIVHASDTNGLVVLTTLKPISVVFTLPQQSLPAVAAAMQAGTPTVLALPQTLDAAAARRPLDRGTLTVLDNQVDQTTGTIKLKATFPNEKLVLWPGAFLTIRLQVEVKQAALVIPPVAVQRGPNGAYVYVVNDDLTVSRRVVKVGHEDQVASIIEEGLKPGERVVTDGASRLSDKSKVTISPPADGAAPATGAPPAGRTRARGSS
jgi:multidrug efflux system membrane fusion protein